MGEEDPHVEHETCYEHEAEETRTWTYELWDAAAVEGYYPTGQYRFQTEVSVDGSVDSAAEWWLDLRVTRPAA